MVVSSRCWSHSLRDEAIQTIEKTRHCGPDAGQTPVLPSETYRFMTKTLASTARIVMYEPCLLVALSADFGGRMVGGARALAAPTRPRLSDHNNKGKKQTKN